MWYTALGAIATIIVGLVCSLIWGFNNPRDIDQRLISPQLQKFFKKKHSNETNNVETKLNNVNNVVNINESNM